MVPIKIFTTGGSLDKGYSTRESAFVVQDPTIGALLQDANVQAEVQVESLLKKDSLELTDEDRALIFRRVREDPAHRILITHGTDTMVETGRALSSISDKTIVLTGAMQPSAFKHSDGPFNVGFALACVQILPAGVYLAMNGKIFHPESATKNLELDRFEESQQRKEEGE